MGMPGGHVEGGGSNPGPITAVPWAWTSLWHALSAQWTTAGDGHDGDDGGTLSP